MGKSNLIEALALLGPSHKALMLKKTEQYSDSRSFCKAEPSTPSRALRVDAALAEKMLLLEDLLVTKPREVLQELGGKHMEASSSRLPAVAECYAELALARIVARELERLAAVTVYA